MSSFSRRDEAVRDLCAQLHADDGVDPKEDKQIDNQDNQGSDRKLQQLCKQVAIAIEMELASLPQAELFSGATVLGVEPAPNAGRVRAVIGVSQDVDPAAVEVVLGQFGGRLRVAVVGSITRRRAPELVFAVVFREVSDE